jgi:hypothetical protein
MGFGREKWVEDPFNVLGIDTGSRVLYADHYAVGVMHPRAHFQNSLTIVNRIHSVGGIHDQI